MKSEGKLFTFLKHDGVPWNNNNAEHAVKEFAYYRRITKGQMTEGGLGDYLVLLSVYQTCRYRGISFLKYLRSGERDIEKACAGGGPPRKRVSLELYPRGFGRNHPRSRPTKGVEKATGCSS